MHVYLVNCGWTMLIIRSRTTKVGEGCIFHGGADDLIVTSFSPPATPASISRIWTFHIPTPSSSISCFFTEHTKPLFIADWSLPPPLPRARANFTVGRFLVISSHLPESGHQTQFTISHRSWKSLISQHPQLTVPQAGPYLSNHQCAEDSEPLHVCRKGVPCKTKTVFSPDVPSSSELVRTSKTIQLLLWERRELINPVTQLTRGVSQNVCIFKFDCIWASVCDWGNCQYSSRKLIYWSFYTSQLERFESWRMKMFASLEVWYPKFPLIRNLFRYSLHTLQYLVHPGPTQYAGL